VAIKKIEILFRKESKYNVLFAFTLNVIYFDLVLVFCPQLSGWLALLLIFMDERRHLLISCISLFARGHLVINRL